jgi:flagellar biosynthesis protein FlhG
MDQAQQLRNAVKMRNRSQNQNQVPHAQIITIAGGKGGVGKSSLAVNLAVQMSRAGKKVIIFDADLGLANIEILFDTTPKYDLSDVIYHGMTMKEIITPGPLDIGFISGGSGVLAMNHLHHDQILYLVKSINELHEFADVILIDTGAGVSDRVLEFVMASREILLVTTPEPSAVMNSYSLLKALYKNPNFVERGTTIHVIANKLSSGEEGRAVFDKLDSVVEQFLHGRLNYLGPIPQDEALERAVYQQKTVSLENPNALSAKAYAILAQNLTGGKDDRIEFNWEVSHLFSNLFSKK